MRRSPALDAMRWSRGAPVAAPITWAEMETLDAPSHFHVGDAPELKKRATSKFLVGWGRADQSLPSLKPRSAKGSKAGSRGSLPWPDGTCEDRPRLPQPWQKPTPGQSPAS